MVWVIRNSFALTVAVAIVSLMKGASTTRGRWIQVKSNIEKMYEAEINRLHDIIHKIRNDVRIEWDECAMNQNFDQHGLYKSLQIIDSTLMNEKWFKSDRYFSKKR